MNAKVQKDLNDRVDVAMVALRAIEATLRACRAIEQPHYGNVADAQEIAEQLTRLEGFASSITME